MVSREPNWKISAQVLNGKSRGKRTKADLGSELRGVKFRKKKEVDRKSQVGGRHLFREKSSQLVTQHSVLAKRLRGLSRRSVAVEVEVRELY